MRVESVGRRRGADEDDSGGPVISMTVGLGDFDDTLIARLEEAKEDAGEGCDQEGVERIEDEEKEDTAASSFFKRELANPVKSTSPKKKPVIEVVEDTLNQTNSP